jgi:pimeloyl-ACP methyl ester carboxylesterase
MRRIAVDGRWVSYAEGGSGVRVLFLHGWGLGHAAYRGALESLVTRGCQVIAPSLPGFGGTADLPGRDRSLRSYAAWLDRFLDALGIDQPLLVLGHSFGGGVATRFAHDFPDRARYLVLLNSVGDPTSFSLSGARTSALVRPGAQPRLPARWRPSTVGLSAATTAGDVFVRNLLTNPVAMLDVATVAMTADLRGEMAVLAQRQLPVLVLWSDRDGLIPMTAFETFCSAFGTDGHVVSGGHSWLLTDPDVFGEVLDNVIRVQRQRDGSEAASANTDELRRLLAETTMPAETATDLVEGVSPMWVMSEPPCATPSWPTARCGPWPGPCPTAATA